MKNFIVVLSLLFLGAVLCAQPINWWGSVSSDWNNPNNWMGHVLPTSTSNITISASATNQPVISNATAYCNQVDIGAGATLTLSGAYNLNVNEDMEIFGNLTISSTAQINITQNIYWESGSTATITNSSARLNIGAGLFFETGSNVQMANGIVMFQGSVANSVIRNYSTATQINTLWINKTAGTTTEILSTTTQPFTIKGHIVNFSGNTFYNNYSGIITLKGNITDSNSTSYGIRWAAGTLALDTNDHTIGLQSTSCYLNSLIFETGLTQLSYPLTLRGNLDMYSNSEFQTNNHTISIGGNWYNDSETGPTAFHEGTGKVVFNGTTHQYISTNETFYTLEVNKAGGALRVYAVGVVATCSFYDWTAGALDIEDGTFTANNLVDNGLYGNYYVNTGGTLNLTNSDGWVNLSGNVYILGGTMNVYGGTAISTWPYGADASLTMSGGVLNFADRGITIAIPGVHSFTYNITGGTIQTTENFSCYNAAFTPGAGMVEMTGTVAAYVTMSSGTLYNLKTDKTVILSANLTCTGGITVSAGYFRPDGYDVSCVKDMLIYGTLRMNSAAVALTVGDDIAWYSGSASDITAGSIEVGGHWYMYGGSTVLIPTTVTTTLKSTLAKTIYIANTGSQFGNLVIGGTTAGAGYTIHSSSTQDLNVAGYLTITANNELDLNTRNMTIAGALNLNGKLDIHATTATVHGKPYLETTSNLTIDTGVFYCDESAVIPRTTYLKGTLYINSGTLTLVNNSLTVNAGSVNTLISGTINCMGVYAVNANTFQPAGGTIVLGNIYGAATYLLSVNNGNWLPSVTIDCGTDGYHLNSDLIIKGSLNLLNGTFDVTTSNYTVTISGSWNHQGGTFNPRSGRVIFNGSGQQYIGYNETFNIVEANKSAGAIRVGVAGVVATIAQYDWTAGSVDALEGTITINDLADNGLWGSFYADTGGILNITNSDNRIDLNGLIQVTGGTINIYGGTAQCYTSYRANATLTMSSGYLNFIDQGIYIYNSPTYTLTYSLTGGTITTTGTFYCNRNDFNPTGGTFEFIGSTDANINFLVNGSSFYNLKINKSSTREQESELTTEEGPTRTNTVNLNSGIELNGGLTLSSGTLNAGTRTINVAGSWQHNSGTFTYGTSTVIFDGSGMSIIAWTETFYNMTVMKTGSGFVSPVDLNTFTITNNLLISSGTLFGDESNDFNIGNLTISIGACFDASSSDIFISGTWLDNNTSSSVLVGFQCGYSEVHFNGTANQTVTRAAGTLRFEDMTINKPVGTYCYFYSPVSVHHHATITSGIWRDGVNSLSHEFEGALQVDTNGIFSSDTSNTVNFIGTTYLGNIYYYASTGGFCNLVINKVATRTDNPVLPDQNTHNTEDTRIFSDVLLHTNLSLLNGGNLTINVGRFSVSSYILDCSGNININNGGEILTQNGTMKIGNSKSLNINNGGLLNIWGDYPSTPATITSITGYYNFNVESGGKLRTEHTIFEKMTAAGVNMKSGSLFYNDHPFTGCTFRTGAAGGTLLTINNSQTVTIEDATFPTNTWSGTYNVRKNVNQGSVNFLNTLGDFAGDSYEYDPYSLIFWTTAGTVDLEIIDAEITSSTPYTGDTVTLTVYIYNGGTLDLTQPVSLDLYKNRTTPPVFGEYGELTAMINSLPSHTAASVDFVLTNYNVESWNTWLQFDPDEALLESNEENNVYGPIGIDWRILPAVDIVSVSKVSTYQILIDWDYTLPVSGYNVYRSTDPLFIPGPANLIAGVTTSQYQTSCFPAKYFYRIKAVRNAP